MPQNRRGFLKQIVATAAVGGVSCKGGKSDTSDTGNPDVSTPVREAEPLRWEPAGEVDTDAFPFGVQVGDVTQSSAIISVQTESNIIEIRVMREDGDGWSQHESLSDVSSTNGFAQVEVSDLPADTAICIAAFAPEGTARSTVTRFRTAIPDDGWRILQFGVTSCLGGNFPWPNLSAAAEYDLDLFIFLGDSVYADGSVSEADYWTYWANTLSRSGMQDLTQSTSIIATWDDHEVDNNWSWSLTNNITEKYTNGLAMFKRAYPQRSGAEANVLWRKQNWGTVADFFVLDCRGERQDGLYVSNEQLNWLKTELSESTARFKFILNSVPIIDYTDLIGGNEADDRWQGYPEQRTELLRHIEENEIEGVLFLAGDFHFSQHARVSPPGEVGDTLYEILCGPSGSFLNPIGELVVETEQYLWAMSSWNSTIFTADPGTGEVHVAFVGDDGSTLHELSLML